MNCWYRSDDGGPLEAKVDQMAQRVVQMSADIQALTNANQQQDQARGSETYHLDICQHSTPVFLSLYGSVGLAVCLFVSRFVCVDC